MRFLWLGKFQSDAPDWTHPARELGEYELMIVDHGTLYIADHSQTHTVHKGEYLIMPPTTLQHGTKPSSCGFHWLHFETSDPIPCPLTGTVTNTELILAMLNTMLQLEQHQHSSATTYLLQALLEELGYENNTITTPPHRPLRERIDEYLKYRQNTPHMVRTLADYFGYHEKYFSTLFYKENGIQLKHYLMEQTMEKGKALLLNTDLPIHEIAAACGFRDAHNFSRAIRTAYHMTPTKLRQTFSQK